MSDLAEQVQRRMNEIRTRYSVLNEERFRLEVERDALLRLLPPRLYRGPRLTDMVRNHLRVHGPATAIELTDAIAPRCRTRSQRPRTVVYNTVLNLHQRGELTRDGGGRMHLTLSPNDKEGA